jgi:hypothetical protein
MSFVEQYLAEARQVIERLDSKTIDALVTDGGTWRPGAREDAA